MVSNSLLVHFQKQVLTDRSFLRCSYPRSEFITHCPTQISGCSVGCNGGGGHCCCGGPPGAGREGCQLSPVGLIFFSNLHRDTVMIMQARCTRDPRGWVGERSVAILDAALADKTSLDLIRKFIADPTCSSLLVQRTAIREDDEDDS